MRFADSASAALQFLAQQYCTSAQVAQSLKTLLGELLVTLVQCRHREAGCLPACLHLPATPPATILCSLFSASSSTLHILESHAGGPHMCICMRWFWGQVPNYGQCLMWSLMWGHLVISRWSPACRSCSVLVVRCVGRHSGGVHVMTLLFARCL